MSYRARFQALVAELERHPDLEITAKRLGPPASEAQLAAVEADLGRRLPDGLRAFYRELDGAEIRWRHKTERWRLRGAWGAINLFDAASLARAPLGPWIPIDFPYDTKYLGLARSSDAFSLVDEADGEARAFTDRFEVYLDALLETRGWSYWQLMFLYQPEQVRYTVDETVGRMQAALPLVFSRFDIARVGGASRCPPANVGDLLEGDRVMIYRLRDLPAPLLGSIPADSPLVDKLFYVTADGSAIVDALFEELEEPPIENPDDADAATRIATEVINVASSTFGFTPVIAPHQCVDGGQITPQVSGGLHGGNADQVERWLRDHGAVVLPSSALLSLVSFFDVRTSRGELLEHVTAAGHGFRRDAPTHIARGLFVIDRTQREWERFTLFHHPGGLSFSADSPGPGEESLAVTLADLAPGEVTRLVLHRASKPVDVPALTEAWIAVGTPSDLPAPLAQLIPPGSPFASRLCWVAPIHSPVVKAMRALVTNPTDEDKPLAMTSAAFRLCDRLEASVEAWRIAQREPKLEAGIHVGDADAATEWLRRLGCRVVALGELLG